MRPISERPVYSLINPVDQAHQDGETFIFFSHAPDMMPLRIACSDVIDQQGHVKVTDKSGKVLARVSNLIPWELVRRGLMLEEEYGKFTTRRLNEEQILEDINRRAENEAYGVEEAERRRRPKLMVMGPNGPEIVEPSDEKQEEPPKLSDTRFGNYL